MGTSAERMRALRERERRGLRRFTIGVSEDDLRVIAEHGYEGAASTDHDQQAQPSASSLRDWAGSARIPPVCWRASPSQQIAPPAAGRLREGERRA